MKQVGWVTNEKPLAWDQVSTDAPPPLDPGIYKARIVSAKPAPTKTQNKPALALELEIFEDGSGTALDKPRKSRDTLVFTQAAQWRIKQVCEATGVDFPVDFELESATEYASGLLKVDGFYLKMKQETFESNGELRTKHSVDRYLKPTEVADSASKSNGASETAAPTRRRRGNEIATA